MFGFRPDGRRLMKGIDPIVQFTPYIMPTRVDAQNFCKQTIDYNTLALYIKQARTKGHNLTFMSIVIAAFVRTVSQCPELNRFVINKQIYARNRISVSFVVLRRRPDDSIMESLAKVDFEATDTVFDVGRKIEEAVGAGREDKSANLTDLFARTLLAVPGLATVVVGLVRLLDRYGLMPGIVYKASPFHTSMFITNMASINMTYIYHHLYNFGTTSIFLGLGKIERALKPISGGKLGYRNEMPIGVVTDERICGGASYARALSVMQRYLRDPSLMEAPPDDVKYETEPIYLRKARKLQKKADRNSVKMKKVS
jgi:hypothetical protein